MRKYIAWIACLLCIKASAQELYVFSEPASNMPARSISIKQSVKLLRNQYSARTEGRYTTELMFGMNKNLMLHVAGSFSDMYSNQVRWESLRAYAKYRFLSDDNMFSHFRMAFFVEGALNRNKEMFDEVSIEGDQPGISTGVIATQLLHKLALSATVSYADVLSGDRFDKVLRPRTPYEALNYSLSAGYLVFPKKYKDYGQTNLNLYAELIGQKTLDQSKYFVDFAPAAQLIFNSTAKLNLGYRFQLGGDMTRMANKSWLLSFEWLFLNAWKKSK